MATTTDKKNKIRFYGIRAAILVCIFIFGIVAYRYYMRIFGPNIHISGKTADYLYIHTGSDYNQVLVTLIQKGVLADIGSFIWLTNRKNYKNHVHPGKYRIFDGMSNNQLVNILRSGSQEPVRVIFNYLKTKEQLAGKISKQLEPDSASLVSLLNNDSLVGSYGFDTSSVSCMFIPNTYEFYWNTSALDFMNRMYREYKDFWNEKRTTKASDDGITPLQVSILASIVEEETNRNDEKARIAGVYINRLKKGMKLEADPTIKFAFRDFSLRRILKKHLKIDSPYNTYKYYGLPPGPVSIPGISSIEAVLNFEDHSYLYFCAKDDLSGYHTFSQTLAEHMKNAKKYQAALNRLNILN